MKRIICIFIAVCIVLCAASCTRVNEAEKDGTQQTPQTNENDKKEPETTNPDNTAGEEKTENTDNTEDAKQPEEDTKIDINDPAAQLRSDGGGKGADVSAAYLGFVTENTVDAIRDCILESACAEEYSFLKDIPDDRIVIIGGCDVFCVVPTDVNAAVKVNKVEYSENGSKIISDTVYMGDASPIILVCNVSDIMANNLVTVNTDGEDIEFSLYLSLKDGGMDHNTDPAKINDFSVYDN